MELDIAAFARECGVPDPEGFAAGMEAFYRILIETNRTLNLTRITEHGDFAVKHVADSLSIARCFPELARERLAVADVGCGAGFPSLVLAFAYPNLELTPIDSTGKKAAFVARTAEMLGLRNVHVVTGRCNELTRRPEFRARFDVVTARAVAPAPVLYRDACNLVGPGGRFLLYKTPGQAQEELPELRGSGAKRKVEWRVTPVFELPGHAGERLFLYSAPRSGAGTVGTRPSGA